jgi:hypothetical protein
VNSRETHHRVVDSHRGVADTDQYSPDSLSPPVQQPAEQKLELLPGVLLTIYSRFFFGSPKYF